MADDDDFAMDDDDYNQDEEEEQDVDLENSYYNAKAMKEDDPRLALEQFQSVRQAVERLSVGNSSTLRFRRSTF